MTIQAQIKVNQKQIAKDIVREVNLIVGKNVNKIQQALDSRISNLVFQRLVSGLPTIQGNDLAEIGVPDINNRLISIARVVSNNIVVKATFNKSLKIDIGILQDDYADLLSLPEAVYRYNSLKGSGILPWLRWLLLEGNGPIIGGFDFQPLPTAFSRTGGGIMTAGGSWNVPLGLAGTANNNIFTRALTNLQKDIEAIVKQELQRIIK